MDDLNSIKGALLNNLLDAYKEMSPMAFFGFISGTSFDGIFGGNAEYQEAKEAAQETYREAGFLDEGE